MIKLQVNLARRILAGMAALAAISSTFNKELMKQTCNTCEPEWCWRAFHNARAYDDDYDKLAYIAGEFQYYIEYDYTAAEHAALHNLAYSDDTYGFRACTNDSMICTDICKLYACCLNQTGIYAKYVDRVSVNNGTAKHAFVYAVYNGKMYRIDITSYCTSKDKDLEKYIRCQEG